MLLQFRACVGASPDPPHRSPVSVPAVAGWGFSERGELGTSPASNNPVLSPEAVKLPDGSTAIGIGGAVPPDGLPVLARAVPA